MRVDRQFEHRLLIADCDDRSRLLLAKLGRFEAPSADSLHPVEQGFRGIKVCGDLCRALWMPQARLPGDPAQSKVGGVVPT